MVNFGESGNYTKYLDVRYTLGGWAQPDLYAYRRLVYAACRRSDLFTALSLFKLVRTRQPTWALDPSIYNAVIFYRWAPRATSALPRRRLAACSRMAKNQTTFRFHGLLNGCQAGDLDAAILVPEKMVKLKLIPKHQDVQLDHEGLPDLEARCDYESEAVLGDAAVRDFATGPDHF